MTDLPDDLRCVVADLEGTALAVVRLCDRCSDAQFHWRPLEGRGWSVAQCIDHLASAAALYHAAMRRAADAARAGGSVRRAPISPTRAGAWFVRAMEPPPGRRAKAPSAIVPGVQRTREDIVGRYHAAHRDLRVLIEDSAGLDVNRTTFSNPFFPLLRMRLGTGMLVIAAHERRHVWQAGNVERAVGYPGG